MGRKEYQGGKVGMVAGMDVSQERQEERDKRKGENKRR